MEIFHKSGARKYAGESFHGVPVEDIEEGIRNGVRKVNIDTDFRIAMTGAVCRALSQDRAESDPRKLFKEATAVARGIRKERFEAFGCAGRASRIKPVLPRKWRRNAPRSRGSPRPHSPRAGPRNASIFDSSAPERQ